MIAFVVLLIVVRGVTVDRNRPADLFSRRRLRDEAVHFCVLELREAYDVLLSMTLDFVNVLPAQASMLNCAIRPRGARHSVAH